MKSISLKWLSVSLFLFFASGLLGQKFTISGYIEDGETGEKLIGANIFHPESGQGASSNAFGFYSLTLPAEDSLSISVSYVGYETKYYKFPLKSDLQMDFKLGTFELGTVEVIGKKVESIEENTQMSTMTIPVKTLKKIPALFGETDIIKALQLLPGVQSGGEGTSGLYVRGGSPDQNLILLDGVPVYNANHLFGFFSVFNPDAINSVSLTKGGFPARYGGRLSSVLDINMKEGNMNEFHGEGAIGLISSKLTLEGPINKGKTSFLVSGRRTYIDLLARPVIKYAQRENDDEAIPGYYFYDVNAKINHKFNDKHRLYFSNYLGKDKFYVRIKDNFDDSSYETEGGIDWGNITSALRWNYLWNNKLFSNVTATYSQYRFDVGFSETETSDGETESFSARYFSGITDVGGKIDFDYIPNPNHHIRFGTGVTSHTFDPGAIEFKEESLGIDSIFGENRTFGTEFALYVEDDMRIGKRLKANAGVHASGFSVDGKFYNSIQPRLGLRYLFPSKLAVKASYATMAQYIHLLTNEGIGLPTDLWVPATGKVEPQTSWQAAIGVAKTFKENYEISVEAYYKEMFNLVSYKEGESFFGISESWENKVEQGQGDSYGLEVFVQKKKGKFTGWVGYTLSWSNRTFENINSGNPYPFKYDRRHDISLVGSYEFNDRVSLSGTWVYGTGNAITIDQFRYHVYEPWGGEVDFPRGVEVPGEKNDYRMPNYHRLDLGVEFKKKKRLYERTWAFGVYNGYSRRNAFYMDSRTVNGEREFFTVSLFPILPYFSWKFKF